MTTLIAGKETFQASMLLPRQSNIEQQPDVAFYATCRLASALPTMAVPRTMNTA